MADQANDEKRRDFWKTLLAMGFDPDEVCTGTYSGIGLDMQVFQRGIYHMKASELIFHFLLTHLDPVRFKREFFDAWPIADPRQARDFRAHVFKWLDEIRRESAENQDGRWPPDTPVRRSYMDESKGLRFEQVLWALTSFVAHALLRNGSGMWAKYLKHPMLVSAGGDMNREMTESVAQALSGCRARYARRMRDRMRAQEMWKSTELELREQIEDADKKRSCVHEAYRTLRMKMGLIESTTVVPEVDASAEDIERALGIMVDETKRLWSNSAGWIEKNKSTIDLVDAVMEKRANSVKLDGHKHVRLAPPPQLAAEWAGWLADHKATPFRGADIDLQVVARMASTCVGALRRSLSLSDGRLSLEDEESITNGDGTSRALFGADRTGDRIQQLDQALDEQESRIERLKRVRAQLAEQQCRAERIVWEKRSGCADDDYDANSVVSVAATPTTHNAAASRGTLQVGNLAAAISRFAIGSSPQERTPASFAKCSRNLDSACKDNAVVRRRRKAVQQLHDLWGNCKDSDRDNSSPPAADSGNLEKILASAWPGLANSAEKAGAPPRLSLMSFMSDSSTATLSNGASRKRTYGSIAENNARPSSSNDVGDTGYRRIKRQASSQADDEFGERMLVDEGVPEFLVQ
ncbi:hypothetical protein IW140_003884 [Coemansia sp. RSA 1813]|nr:hypothetical protein LPJ74_002966 [Coemansia sp. RSA 1843]KAJ2215710.1 hypothetical protein EV179_001934 [Coemansia sp. RSA 487]KAJ2568456.1 hypothetical protein IW140_003884 [Coemansia sp. RSA 1813]